METYAKILMIAMPIFFGLVLLEKWYGYAVKKDAFKPLDMISSLSSGITNSVKDVLQLSFTILSYAWMVDHLAIYQVQSSLLAIIVAFVALDFSGYWIHRMSHEINFFWNKHAIHHSSEEFNLACALRQSISSFVSLFTIFLLPAALLGVPVETIAIISPIHFFAQFWYHTTYINRMGFLEHIIVTPSHHRVHHAINVEYMDKNHGQIFIIWDKLFGTFQEELESVPPVYGISRPAQTWNPIKINFQHLFLLIKDAFYTSSWKDKFRIWFMPTGWRPADVESKYAPYKIESPYDYQKYYPSLEKNTQVWIWIQFLFTFFMIYVLYFNLGHLSFFDMCSFAAIIYLSVYGYTEQMDNNPKAWQWELIKSAIGVSILGFTTQWEGVCNNNLIIKLLMLTFWLVSPVLTFYLTVKSVSFKKSFN
jgi:alkylglycerol monooxygenase